MRKSFLFLLLIFLVACTPESPVEQEIPPETEDEMVFCTQDVMECFDGSYVSRTGPDCEFAPCP